MPQIIKNTEAEELTFNVGSVTSISSLNGVVKQEDYVDLYGFIAYLQNFTKVDETVLLSKPLNFGLKNNLNLKINNLEIDY
jgi:hypothetical protein